MNKLKTLGLLSVLLLLINVILVLYIVFQKPKHPKQLGPRNIIIERLHFNDTQICDYDKLIKNHRNDITICENDIKNLKNKLYSNLPFEIRQGEKDSLINQLTLLQSKIENINYNHFLEIKNLCKNDQIADFKNLTIDIAALFAHPPIKGVK